MTMKKHLLLVFILALIGCASISFKPVAHPDQRIQLGGFSFLPPSGKNWEVSIDPLEYRLYWETWGRSTLKVKLFNKNIVEPSQALVEIEKLKVSVFIYEFVLMKFDKDDDLLELPQDGYIVRLENSPWIGSFVNDENVIQIERGYLNPGRKWISNDQPRYTLEKINELRCATYRGFHSSEVVHYIQKFICVHPNHPDQIIKLRFDHTVLKGYTPTDIQGEIDSFFDGLQFH